MIKENFEYARRKYKPKIIKFLLIAEAPPKVKSKRFFYFENVQKGDSLFIEIMKVLYPGDPDIKSANTKNVRRRKEEFLERFKNDGFYLIDALNKPMKDTKLAKKKRQIRKCLPSLVKKVRRLISNDTKIILISKTVHEVCYKRLGSEGFNVINECTIPFPIGWQKKFREKLGILLH